MFVNVIYCKELHFDQSKQPQSLWKDVRWLLCATKAFVSLAFTTQYGVASTRHKEYRCTKAVPSRKTNIPHTWTTHTLSYLGDCLYRRPVLQKELHHFQSVFLTGNVEGSKTILRHYKRENTCVQKSMKIVQKVFVCVLQDPADLEEYKSWLSDINLTKMKTFSFL